MWAYEHHFCTEDADDGHTTKDCGVEVEFDQSSCFSHRDENLIEGKLGYIGKIQEIMQVDFSSFQCIIFKCKWWDTFGQNNVKVDHDSGLICINSKKILAKMNQPYIFPKHCNHVFLHQDVLDQGWWFILRHDSRSKHLFENNNVVMPNDEDNQGDGNEE